MFGARNPQAQGGGNFQGARQTADADNVFAGAGSAVVAPALPGTAVGRPLWMMVVGSVTGKASIQIGNLAVLTAASTPNAPPVVVPFPANAFPNAVNSVSVTLTADGAGTLRVIVGFL